MSGGLKCTCEEAKKPLTSNAWRVSQYMSNHSAFNGYHYTPSDYSAVVCDHCNAYWRTKANYVDILMSKPEPK